MPDQRLAAGERAPLLGVPVAIKDDTDLAGETTAVRSYRHVRAQARGRGARTPAEARRRGDRRQDHDTGAGSVADHRGSRLRGHPQSVEPRAHPRRILGRLGRGGRGRRGRRRGRVRRPRVDPRAGGMDAPRGYKAAARPRLHVALPGRVQRPHVRRSARADCLRRGPDCSTRSPATMPGTATTRRRRPEPYARTAERADPGRPLRIALSFKIPFSIAPARLDPRVRAAVESLGAALTRLGHRVERAEPTYGIFGAGVLPRSIAGLRPWVAAAAEDSELDERTRHNAQLGRLLGPLLGVARRARRADAPPGRADLQPLRRAADADDGAAAATGRGDRRPLQLGDRQGDRRRVPVHVAVERASGGPR